MRLEIQDDKFSLDLEFSNADDLLLNGEQGYYAKGHCSNYASYHYTYPRTKMTGEVEPDGLSHAV